MSADAPIDCAERWIDLSDCDDSIIETIIASLPLSARARFERTCQRCRRVSREMIEREMRLIRQRPATCSFCDAIIARIRIGAGVVDRATLTGAIAELLRASMDTASAAPADESGSTLRDESLGVLNAYWWCPAIGRALVRYVFQYAAARRAVAPMCPLPALLGMKWPRAVRELSSGPPICDVYLRGFLDVASSFEEYMELMPPSMFKMAPSADVMDSVADAFVSRGGIAMSDLVELVESHTPSTGLFGAHWVPAFGARADELIARVAVRLVRSEGLSIDYIHLVRDLSPPDRHHGEDMSPLFAACGFTIAPYTARGEWWLHYDHDGSHEQRQLRRLAYLHPRQRDSYAAAARRLYVHRVMLEYMAVVADCGEPPSDIADGLAALREAYPEFDSEDLMGVISECVAQSVTSSADYDEPIWRMITLTGLLMQPPERGAEPLVRPEDALALLRIVNMTAEMLRCLLRCGLAGVISFDSPDSPLVDLFALSRWHRWDSDVIIALRDHLEIRGACDVPSSGDLVRYLRAIDDMDPSEDHEFVRGLIKRLSVLDAARTSEDDAWALMRSEDVIEEYEHRWPRAWHVGRQGPEWAV